MSYQGIKTKGRTYKIVLSRLVRFEYQQLRHRQFVSIKFKKRMHIFESKKEESDYVSGYYNYGVVTRL